MPRKRNLSWSVIAKQYLESIGIRPDREVENLHKVALEKVKEKFHHNSFKEIKSDQSKLIIYSKVKTYLNSLKNMKGRYILTKIGLPNHNLMIEKAYNLFTVFDDYDKFIFL